MRKAMIAALVLVCACSDDDEPADSCTVRLTATGDVQTAVQSALIAAKAGDVLCFGDGTYSFSEELSLTVDGVTLRGNVADRTKVVFDFSGQVKAGNPNGIQASGTDDLVLEGFVVRDTAGDAIKVTEGKNLTFRNVTVEWVTRTGVNAGAYGFYPVLSENILIDNCEARGANDAGIYVGQSKNALVRNSRAEGNVAGIEIENTDDAEVRDNVATGNVTGILVFNLPGIVRKTGSRTKVHHNTVESNNIDSFATSGTVAYLPPGAGILMFGNDNAEFHDNTIRTNASTAIVVTSCDTLALVASISGGTVNCVDDGYDGFSEGVYIHDNTITGNGSAPKGFYAQLAAATQKTPFFDILWDGVVDPGKPASDANRLCIKNNAGASFGKLNLSSFTATSDLAPHDCTHPALAGVTVTW